MILPLDEIFHPDRKLDFMFEIDSKKMKSGFTIKQLKMKTDLMMEKATIILMQLLFVLSLNAQNREIFSGGLSGNKNVPKIGITGGMQLGNFHSGEVGDPNVQAGLNLGFTCNVPVSNRISIEPQLIYSRKGGEIDYTHAAYFYYYNGSMRYRLHYLEMPLLFNIHASSTFDFILGGYAGYLADATFHLSTPLGYGYGELNYGDFEKFDYGLTGGIAFNFPLSKIAFKYSYGFGEVANENSAYIFLEGAKNNVFSISFTGYFR